MSAINDIFLVDTNCFIAPYKQYYSFSIAPGFWTFLKKEIGNGNIMMLDLVYAEIKKGSDALSDWIDGLGVVPVDRREPDIINAYKEVLTHVQTSPFYNEKALAAWSDARRADAWLVAAAKTYGYTVITFEASNSSLGSGISGSAKIPDVCAEFNVKCENLFYMLDKLRFSFPV